MNLNDMGNGKMSTQLQVIFKLIIVFCLFAIPNKGFAQYDYEHYVPPFYNGSSTDNDIGYHRAILSTNSVKDIRVYIYRGYDDEIDVVTISNTSPYSYPFLTPVGVEKGDVVTYPHKYNFPENVVGAKELNKKLSDDGLRFYSPDGPFFVNMRHSTRDQGSSLTTKGTYAYGTEFLSGHTYTHQNSATSRRSHFISVMATEDNTVVNFTDIKVSRLTEFNSATNSLVSKVISPTDVITTTTLMRGDSYVIGVDHDLSGFSNADKNALNGTSITSNKPIAVNSGSWTTGPSGQDIGVDQIVPIDQVRNEYIIMRGKGNYTTERPIIVATEDNTRVEVNGVYEGTIAKKGGYMDLNDPYDGNGNAYVLTDKNVYVYQTLSGSSSSIGPTVGMNFIPPVSTSGIREVTVPYAEVLSKQGVTGVITILSQTGAVISYSRDGEEALHPISNITGSPVKISGVPQWEIYKLDDNLKGSYRFYSNKAINVAWLVKSGVVGAAGYYSGFTKEISKIIPDLDINTDVDLNLICESYDDNIIVSIKDPAPDFYEWYVNDFEGEPNFPDGPLNVPAPDVETTYYVVGSYRDPLMDQLYNGSFFELTVDSDYDEVFGNLRNPGEYSLVRQTTNADPSFKYPTFSDMDNDYMFMAISKNFGDTIYRGTKVDVVDGFNYIVKLHGRSVVNEEYTTAQSLKVMVNDEVIVDNFKIEQTNDWQSVSALWKPKGAENAVIKLLNNNASGIQSAFALDSITFVQAVQDTATFVARVVPNYSYGNNDKTFHFCEGVRNSLDVSNGDVSWYDYSWSKKEEGTENYIDLVDNDEFSGVKTHQLFFENPQQINEGEYRCSIGFKEEYTDCGTSTDNVHADLTVLVDEAATINIDANHTNFCFGKTATLTALVTGDAGEVKWYVNGGDTPVSLENPFVFADDYAPGTYTIRCEAENGCGKAFDEISLRVLSAPELTDLTVNDNLCENKDVILTAEATGSGTLNYNWKEGTTDLTEKGSTLTFPASMDDRSSIYSVSVSSVYTIDGVNFVCPDDLTMSVENLDIIPIVTIDDEIDDVTLCEGATTHTFEVGVTEADSYYNFVWEKDGEEDEDTAGAQKIVSPIALSDAGTYKVTVSNGCDSKESTATLSVTPKMVVTSITADPAGPFCSPTNVTVTFTDNGAVSEYRAKKPDNSIITITNPYSFEINNSTEGTWEFIAEPNCVGDNFTYKFTWNIIPDFGDVTIEDVGTCLGEEVSFHAVVEDVSDLSNLKYLWKNEAEDEIGTEAVLTIDNVEESDLGIYTCTVSDQCNTETESATLSIQKVNTPKTSAVDIEVCEGDNFSFDIDYIGTPTFEWSFKNKSGVIKTLSESTGSLTINPVSKDDEGIYYCTVHLICGDDVTIQRNLVVHKHVSIDPSADEIIDICQGEKPLLNVEVKYTSDATVANSDDYTIIWTDDSDNPLVGFGDVNQVQLNAHNTPGTYTYKAKVTSFCDNLSKTYIVKVHEKPILSTLDNNVEECAGVVSLNITESGEHNGISWWKNELPITDGNTEPTNYVIDPATSPASDGNYIAKVNSNFCGDDQVSISVDITNNIVVTDQSDAITTVCENKTISLSVTADAGGDEIHYKWTQTAKPTKIFPNTPSIELKDVMIDEDAGEYTCELSNDLGCGNVTLTFNVVVNKNPKITKDPDDQIICETEVSVDFTVAGDVQGDIHYQWYDKDDVAVGTDHPTLTVVPVDGQSYHCKIWGDACGEATTQTATLTIIPKVAVTNPNPVTINDGADASFSVTASGEKEYSYQWEIWVGPGVDDYNPVTGAKYSGINTAELKITNALKADFDGNQYRCVVTSDGAICTLNATAISSEATLTINSINKIVSAGQPENQVVCEGENITFSITGTKTTGLTYQWQYHEGDNVYKNADVSDVNTVGDISTYTISGATQDMENWRFRCLVSDGLSTPQLSNEVMVDVWENIVVSTSDDSGLTACVDAPFSITVEATGDILKYKWYKVGDESISLSDKATFSISKVDLSHQGTYKVDVYNDQNCNNETRTFGVDVLELLTLDDPEDVVMCTGDADPTFMVKANGDGPFTYQWFDKDHNSVGTNDAILTVDTPVDGQSYYCEVFNNCNTIISKSALLTVVEPLVVIDPIDQLIADNGTAHFNVTASGEPNYSYQWQVWVGPTADDWSDLANDVNYSDVKTNELTVSNATIIDGFDGKQYRCVVTTDGVKGCIRSVESNFAELSIDALALIKSHPSDQKLCENLPVTFIVEVMPTVDTYNWFYNDGTNDYAAKATWDVSVSGELTIDPVTPEMDGWEFYCEVAIGTGSPDPTNKAKLTVWEEVAITSPVNLDTPIEVCKGESRNLSVIATGDEREYKWYEQATPATVLSTTESYFVDEINADIVYVCEVSNDCVTESRTFTFTVRDELVITTPLTTNTICEGELIPEFNVAATGYAPLSYHWFENGVEVPASNSDKFTPATAVDGNTYYCVITDGCGKSLTSDVAELIVNQGVTITSEPSDITISDGENATFELTAIGDEIPGTPITYQWQILNGASWDNLADDVTYSGCKTASLEITKANLSFNGKQYRCLVSNTCSTDVESATVILSVNALYKILTPPSNIQACLNDEVYFEIVGTTPGLDYAWEYENGSGIFVNAEVVPGMSEVLTVNGSKLKIDNASLTMASWTFRCIVSDGSSTDDISNVVSMEVFEPIEITPIDNQELCFDESKQITLDVTSGTEPYTYSWTKDATEVSATAIVNIGGADNGNYKVIASNGGVCPDKSSEFTVIHHSKLSLDAWENADHVCIGTPETLSVSIDNVDPALTLSYKWYKDGAEIVGETSVDYILTAADKSKAGQYKVEVFDGCSTEFVSGYVDVYQSIAPVSIWPAEKTLCLGEELNLEAIVSGDATSYTWTKNDIPFVANTTHLIAEVGIGDAGIYKCVIKDECGIEITYIIDISILSIPEITKGLEILPEICEGEVLELGPIEIVGTYDAIKWTLSDDSEDNVSGLNLILGAAITEMEGNYKVAVSNVCGEDVSVGTQIVNPTPTLASIDDQTVCQNEDVVFRAETSGRDLHYQWKIDGVDQATDAAELIIDGTEVLPDDPFSAGTYNIECIVTNDNGCGEILNETAQLIVNPSTILNTTLKNVVKYVGDDYTMALDVTGDDLVYTWSHVVDGVKTDLTGITGSFIDFTNIQMSDAGYYNCVITGICGTRLASGKLTVKEPVKIIDGLTNFIEKCEGESLNLTLSASGQITSKEWFKDGNPLGNTEFTHFIPELSIADAGTYTCVIKGEGLPVSGIEESTIVRVYSNTTLNAPIGNQTICENDELNWSPNISGAADLTYKWFFGGTEVSTKKDLHYDNLTLAQEGEYEVQVKGFCGDVSSSGTLEVTELPKVIGVSDNNEVCENTSLVEFSVLATGENLRYQWRKNTIDIAGKTSPTLSLTSIQLDDEATYDCRVYNSCGEDISASMELSVIPQLSILSEPVDLEVCAGEPVTFTAEVVGNDVNYQWKLNGTDITGATNSVYDILETEDADNGYYTCIVSDFCTDSRSTKPTELVVNKLPNSEIIGRMVLCAKEDRVTYTTIDQKNIVYGWGVDGGIFAGPDEGLRTRITWEEVANGELSIMITNNETGCSSKVDSLVTLNALPEVNLEVFDSKGVCEESFELSGGYPAGGIYWVNGISEETFDPADKGPGEYTIHYSYTDKFGCSNVTETTSLKVDELPTVDITDDTTIGSCSPFTLVADTKEDNIKWSPADNLNDVNSMTPIFTPGESQVYVASVMDEHGCVGIDLVNLNVAPLPEVTTIEDITAGQCNELQLLTDIVGDAGEITWTNPDHLDDPTTRSPRIVNAPEGTYTYKINVVDLYGCDAGDEVTVSIVADPELDEDKFGCEGDQFEVNLTGMDKPIWDDGYAGDTRTVETPGKYTLTVENEYGCGDKQNFVINPTPNPKLMDYLIIDGPDEVEIVEGKPVIIFEGQTLTLGSNLPLEYSPYNFTWEDGKEGSILQRYDVTETGLYKLTVVDNLGCVAKDSVDVEVKPVGIEQPSAFTPNSNNENDRFYLKDINYDIQKYEMYVYDRWGELLFIGSEPGYNGGWDGQYKGKLCPTGAYVWMLFINGDLTNKGTFMLIR